MPEPIVEPPPSSEPVADELIDLTRSLRVLLVDDDPSIGVVVAACLDFEGAEVRTAHSLAEARELLGPDLDHVVLDRRLPDGDGLDLLPDLAASCPEVPIVVFSAYDDPAEVDLPHVAKSDIAALVDLLGLEPEDHVAVDDAPEGGSIVRVFPIAAGDAEGL
ncbi:response regulator [Aquihabitans sp. G128]|uniref:response regulator n=1 Tax=Aquihabitans sp. G128 TaxID=2849779 RepID=UPI001C250895|nr:response regulator [Aquihabitans sp. G128]QXC59846.1 response regulator [Aquihabitans sp. G128]